MPARRVMTGATGFVGSHFLRRWLKTGSRIHALVRAASEAEADTRLSGALENAARSVHAGAETELRTGAMQALCADLLREQCAMSERALFDLRHSGVDEFWHFAASLKYEERHRAAIFQSNLEGTRQALRLAFAIRSPWFVYVSTAYTAGRQKGRVPEALHGTQVGFNNCYEESKAFAENEVASFCEAHGMKYAILRPSIVIGPYSTKTTGGSTTGLYGFAREMLRLKALLCALARPVEICGEAETLCNLIPVDWFADDVMSLIDEGMKSGGVYHHTCEQALTIQELGEILARVLELPGFSIRAAPSPGRSALEELIEKRTDFYGGYLSNSKVFERARAFAPRLSAKDVLQYLREYVRENSSRASATEAPIRV